MGALVPRLVSIGYQGRTVDELFAHLIGEGVSVLVDVRLTPASRQPGMSKRRLAETCKHVGISYVHLRQLGNPKENRSGFRAGNPAARDRFRHKLDGDDEAQALHDVFELLDDHVVALLCFERSEGECHRGLVVEALARHMPDITVVRV